MSSTTRRPTPVVIANGWSLGLTAAATAGPVVNLAVGMASAPGSVYSGATLTNTITVTNLGPDTATGVVLTNPLPAGVSFISAFLSQGTLSGTDGGLVTCSLGTLPAGGSATVTIMVSPDCGGGVEQYGQCCGQRGGPQPGQQLGPDGNDGH